MTSVQPDRPAPLTIALYQPDIPQNAGTILRMCACLGLAAAIIEPAGFPASDKHLRRAGMDYLDHVNIARHPHWTAFDVWRRANGRRLVLLTTKASLPYTSFSYLPGDILLVGRESAGVPEDVHESRRCTSCHSFKAATAVFECRGRGGNGGGGSCAANAAERDFLRSPSMLRPGSPVNKGFARPEKLLKSKYLFEIKKSFPNSTQFV